MKIHRSALGVVLVLVSLSMAKTIPTSEPISSGTEKKAASLGAEDSAPPTKPQVPEVPAAIAVEAAQEPKQADRTKKSATTTFCVEIRPGQSDGPVKVCDEHNPLPPSPPSQSEPQIPIAPPPPPQELHHQQLHHEEHEQLAPFFVLPPNPLALYIPNNEGQSAFVNCPPGNSQHIIMPSAAPASFPCPSLPSSSQHIIIPSSGAATYPSIASSSSAQHLIIPSSPSGASQHIVIPSTASGSGHLCPCQCATSANGLNPHTLISLFRSAMARNGDNNMSPAAPMDPAMSMEMMRSGSSVDWLNGINSGSMLTEGPIEASNQMPYGSEQSSLDTPFARTHIKKIYALPIGSYYGAGYQAKSPYVVQCNPQVLALGGGGGGGGGSTLVLSSGSFRDADGNANINNMENGAGKVDQSLHMNEGQMNLGTPQGGRHHVIHPIVQPIIHTTPGASFHSSPSVYQHSSTYQTYQSRPGMYPASHDTGYMIHPGSHFYRREGQQSPQQLQSWMNNRNIQQNPSSDMEMQQRQQQKSWNQQAGNMEQQRGHGGGGAMSPSQMLNQMRGVGSNSAGSSSSSFGSRTSPVMQSFPREHEESSPCKEGVHVNMHIPSGGQPFMITAPRNNRDDKNMATNHGGAMHDEMGKREAEKSAVSEIDA